MSKDELERALSDDTIEPSSGFSARVMDSVRQAAAQPPPLPFPWFRLALGIVACGLLAAAGARLAVDAIPLLLTAFADSTLASAATQLAGSALGVAFAITLARLLPRIFARS
jgi:hypothetical protein